MIPTHLQIETINGVCTARCTMCAFETWKRTPHRMSMGDYITILNKFMPYRDHLQYLSLFGFGEPLLDKELPLKVRKAKEMGFKSVGFATNCTELDLRIAIALMEAGLDTIICSVDGIKKETHEAIRVGTNFHEVVGNIIGFLFIRSIYSKHGTKVIIRFIKQKSNIHEWEEFKAWWGARIDPSRGDAVISFDIVDVDGKVADYKDKDVLEGVASPLICREVYDRMLVLSNGDVALCCADDNGEFNLGNVLHEEPVEIYNNDTFKFYRTRMEEGRIGELFRCNTCTIRRSMKTKGE